MLDVHPPHHAASTWRDFFVHIATICVGLLIAVGLEQSVEAFHRRQERRELEAQVREEAERNVAIIQADLKVDGGYRAIVTQAMNLIRNTPAQRGYIDFIFPAPPVLQQRGRYRRAPFGRLQNPAVLSVCFQLRRRNSLAGLTTTLQKQSRPMTILSEPARRCLNWAFRWCREHRCACRKRVALPRLLPATDFWAFLQTIMTVFSCGPAHATP